MSDITVLTAAARERVGKGSAREARRQGKIPAVIYGDKKSPASITLERKLLVRHLESGGFFNTLFDIELDGKLNRVLPRDVQLHPVTDVPEHIDFLRVSSTTRISVEVPVEFKGEDESPGFPETDLKQDFSETESGRREPKRLKNMVGGTGIEPVAR